MTTIVQIMLLKIGLAFLLSSNVIDITNIPWGIACMFAATTAPRILREFLVPTGGGTAGNTFFQTVRVAQMVRGAIK